MNQIHAACSYVVSQLCLSTIMITQFTKSLSHILNSASWVIYFCRNVYFIFILNFSFYLIDFKSKNELELLFNFYDAYVGNDSSLKDTHFAP